MEIVGIESGMRGTDNQMRGLALSVAKNKKKSSSRERLLKGIDGKILRRHNYKSDEEFRNAVFMALENFYLECIALKTPLPDFVILPYIQSNTNKEAESVDILSQNIKDFFAEHKHPVKTMVIASKLYPYKSVDIINVGHHQMNKLDEMQLRVNQELSNKTVITEGMASNLSWLDIKMRSNTPNKATEFAKYQGKKIALFSLGGKTANGAIQFTIDDADRLLASAEKIRQTGYEVIFTNSPRTPNDVTDYLFEKCAQKNITFYNSKIITNNQQDAIDNFTLYNGKYNKEFKQQAKRTHGNAYPALLSLVEKNGFVVNTWDSFSYTSDIAPLGITSVVYDGNYIDITQRPDCKKLFDHCLANNYIHRLDDKFIALPAELKKTKPMTPVNNVLISAMKKSLQSQKQIINNKNIQKQSIRT